VVNYEFIFRRDNYFKNPKEIGNNIKPLNFILIINFFLFIIIFLLINICLDVTYGETSHIFSCFETCYKLLAEWVWKETTTIREVFEVAKNTKNGLLVGGSGCNE